jgi:hypothetical protein
LGSEFDRNFEIRIRCFWSNFVPRRIHFKIRPSLQCMNCYSRSISFQNNFCQSGDEREGVAEVVVAHVRRERDGGGITDR